MRASTCEEFKYYLQEEEMWGDGCFFLAKT